MTEPELFHIAAKEFIRIFGRKYLHDNNRTSCTAEGIIANNTYMLFLGIKGSKDLPDRKATPKGWVVYGLIHLDTNTGEIKKLEYQLE